jgi:ankyrin repeat protein
MQTTTEFMLQPATCPLLQAHDDSIEIVTAQSRKDGLRWRVTIDSELSDGPVLEIIQTRKGVDLYAVIVEMRAIQQLIAGAGTASWAALSKRIANALMAQDVDPEGNFDAAGTFLDNDIETPPPTIEIDELYPVQLLDQRFTALLEHGLSRLDAAYQAAQSQAQLITAERVDTLHKLPLCQAVCVGCTAEGNIDIHCTSAFVADKVRVLVNAAGSEQPRVVLVQLGEDGQPSLLCHFDLVAGATTKWLVRWYYFEISGEAGQAQTIPPWDERQRTAAAALFAKIEPLLIAANATFMEAQQFTQALLTGKPAGAVTLGSSLWQPWLERLQWMESRARARDWSLTPLHILPPATPAEIKAIESAHDVQFPKALREVLLHFSAGIAFGWRASDIDQPAGALSSFYIGGMRDTLWDLRHIDEYAIGNFRNWQTYYFADPDADEHDYEEPNPESMWEHQFPIASLANGDMLTIDCALDGEPVRYFSHEIEGLHGHIIAATFYSFIDEYTRLGCVGSEQSTWLQLCEPELRPTVYGDTPVSELRHDHALAKKWLAWLAREPGVPVPGEPPRGVRAKTEADFALLKSAQANDLNGITSALKRGATVDAINTEDWREENVTALAHAVTHGNIEMMALLATHGAALNTRKLPLITAAAKSTPDLVRWLIDHGSRVNAWNDDQHHPLHALILHRPDEAPGGVEAYFEILDLLLSAGADPNAPCDNGDSMLTRCGPQTARRLLAKGANPAQVNRRGYNALHTADTPELIELFVQHGAPINGYSQPQYPADYPPCTPLHYLCRSATGSDDKDGETEIAAVRKMLELGAEVTLKDARGRTALQQCRSAGISKLLQACGQKITDLTGTGWTVLQVLAEYCGCRIKRYEAFIRHAIAEGVNINAHDKDGKTILHWAARDGEIEDVKLLLALGADKKIRDHEGKNPAQRVSAKRKQMKSMLT